MKLCHLHPKMLISYSIDQIESSKCFNGMHVWAVQKCIDTNNSNSRLIWLTEWMNDKLVLPLVGVSCLERMFIYRYGNRCSSWDQNASELKAGVSGIINMPCTRFLLMVELLGTHTIVLGLFRGSTVKQMIKIRLK